jgi:hypothetical protein
LTGIIRHAPASSKMTRVTIGLTLAGLVVLFIAYAKGVGAIHGGDVLGHMYWATAAITLVALGNFIAVAHLARAERMIQELRGLCEKNGIEYGED